MVGGSSTLDLGLGDQLALWALLEGERAMSTSSSQRRTEQPAQRHPAAMSAPGASAANHLRSAPRGDRPLTEPLLDAASAARLLSVRPSWVYEAVRAGRLPHLKIGRHIRFLRSDLEEWVLSKRVDGTSRVSLRH